MQKKTTQEEALNKCKKVHGDKYDYSKMIYNGTKKLLEIGCPIHGWFWQSYQNHASGRGCHKCAIENRAKAKYLSQTEALARCIKKHKNKYDHSRFVYTGVENDIEIGCKTHGWFFIRYNDYVNDCGCPKCSDEKRSFSQRSDIKDLKILLHQKHNNKYDYSLITEESYKNQYSTYPILCPTHGIFYQRMQEHLKGQGCPMCKQSKGEKLIYKFLQGNKIDFVTQKTFDGCRYKRKLIFDFYIPDKNILIEYDGWQHFFANDAFGGEEAFKEQEIKDEIKNKYCEDNNISLIRIPYWLSDEETKDILING